VRKAGEIAGEMVAVAEEHGSAEHTAFAATLLAQARMFSGDFEPAARDYERPWAIWESVAKPVLRRG